MMRLNKFLSTTGVASRRKAEELITSGQISVNGKVVTNLATTIDEKKDSVFFNGKHVDYVANYIYLMLYKPKGCVTTVSDDKNRKTVMDFIPEKYRTLVKPVGRLDYDSEGLLLFTNDGDFASKVTHPSSQIKKTYIVKIEGKISPAELKTLRSGITTTDGTTFAPCQIKVTDEGENFTRLEVVITEGKNREIRRMFESAGKVVTFLKRTQIGSLRLGGLSRGVTKPFDPKYVFITKK